MGKSHLVSIIMPTYNRAHLIHETIDSVLGQSYNEWELVIVDDGSTDDTENIVRRFNDGRIRYYKIEHCGLVGKVRNMGLKFSHGDFIAFLDSDDLWIPDKLHIQLSLFTKYQDVAFVFSHGEQFGKGAIPPPVLEQLFIGDVFFAHLLEERFVLYPSTFIFKKDVLPSIGSFDEAFSAGESDFFLRMARKFEGIFTGDKLVKLRKHTQNISSEREFIFTLDNIRMIKKFLINDFITRKQYVALASKQYYKQGILYLKRGKPSESLTSFLKCNTLKPFQYKGWLRLAQACVLSLIPSSRVTI